LDKAGMISFIALCIICVLAAIPVPPTLWKFVKDQSLWTPLNILKV